MATSGDLAMGIAAVTGMRVVTVHTQYRRLREAGLIPKAGRGPQSSIRMTSAIAATLLTAVLGRFLETDTAADAVMQFRNVTSSYGIYIGDIVTDKPEHEEVADGDGIFRFGIIDVPILEALPPGHTVEDAVRALIESFMTDPDSHDGEYFHDHWWRARKHFSAHDVTIQVSVTFTGPQLYAEIEVRIWAHPKDKSEKTQSISAKLKYTDTLADKEIIDFLQDVTAEKLHNLKTARRGDFSTTREISHRTLIAAAEIIEDFYSDEGSLEDAEGEGVGHE